MIGGGSSNVPTLSLDILAGGFLPEPSSAELAEDAGQSISIPIRAAAVL